MSDERPSDRRPSDRRPSDRRPSDRRPSDRAVMVPPQVNAVGVLEAGDEPRQPRVYTNPQRVAAWSFLLIFIVATLVTSAVTLGAYCLTSDGGDTREVRDRLDGETSDAPQ